MIYMLDVGEYIVADGGYQGGFQFVISRHHGPDWLKRQTVVATARHETVNSRLKIFGVLKEPFRGGMERHESVFNALANIVRVTLMFESPLFEVEYNDKDYIYYLQQMA